MPTITKIYSSNEVAPQSGGDLTTVIVEVAGTALEAYPGFPGEAVDLSAYLIEVFGCSVAAFAGAGELIVPYAVVAADNDPTTVTLAFAVTGDAADAVLNDLAAAAYPFDWTVRLVAIGRPATDAA